MPKMKFSFPTYRLDDLTESIMYGHTASATKKDSGSKFLRITDIQNDTVNWDSVPYGRCSKKETEKYSLKRGDIVFARTGATTGKNYLIKSCPENSVFASYLIRVRPNDKVDSEYLARFFDTPNYWGQIKKSSTRATLPGVNATKLKELKIPLPPLPEQKRIAAILDKADVIHRKRRQAIQLANEFLRSVFLDIFGDPIKNTKDWKLFRFGDICESRLGKMLDSKQQTGENQRKYLRNANVQWDQFDLNSLLEMDFSEKDRNILRLKHGDLLICEGGEVGRTAIWRNEILECYFQKALHRVRPKNKMATAEYLLHLMWFFSRKGGFKDHATSATIAHLTGVKLKEMVIPLPPLELQKKFSNYYFSTKSLKIRYSYLINESKSLFNSISQRAFRGEF